MAVDAHHGEADESQGTTGASARPLLIVEDDVRVARAIARVVRRFRPAEVEHSVAGALERLNGGVPMSGAIIDIGLPDGSGVELLARLRSLDPVMPALVLTGHLDRELINRVHALRGEYLCKPAGLAELSPFMQRVTAHEQVAYRLLEEHVLGFAARFELTLREAEILGYALAGHDRAEVAARLGIAENTVKCEIRSLLRKTGAKSLAALARQVLHAAWERQRRG